MNLTKGREALRSVLRQPERRDVDRILSAHFWGSSGQPADAPDAGRRRDFALLVLPRG